MLRGMSTVSHYAEDLDAASAWYTELLGLEPYYSVDGPDGAVGYLEWRIGDYQHELGLIDARFAAGGHRGSGGSAGSAGQRLDTVLFWAVDDARAALARLVELGAAEVEPVTERGPGFVTAVVRDPFGNTFGVMENAHYHEVLAGFGHDAQPEA